MAVPIVLDLRNPGLKQRHWDRVQEVLGVKNIRDKSFTLGMLLDLNVVGGMALITSPPPSLTPFLLTLLFILLGWIFMLFYVVRELISNISLEATKEALLEDLIKKVCYSLY